MKKLIIVLLGSVALGACKKDDASPSPAAPSRTDLLTGHAWKISTQTATITAGGNSITTTTIDACSKDDFYQFKTNQAFVADEGATKCSSSDPQQETGTWAFSNSDQTKLKITLPSSALNGEVEVKELTSSTLHLYTNQSANGATYTVDAVLVPN